MPPEDFHSAATQERISSVKIERFDAVKKFENVLELFTFQVDELEQSPSEYMCSVMLVRYKIQDFIGK